MFEESIWSILSVIKSSLNFFFFISTHLLSLCKLSESKKVLSTPFSVDSLSCRIPNNYLKNTINLSHEGSTFFLSCIFSVKILWKTWRLAVFIMIKLLWVLNFTLPLSKPAIFTQIYIGFVKLILLLYYCILKLADCICNFGCSYFYPGW